MQMKIGSVGKELTHTPKGREYNSCYQHEDLFGGWSVCNSFSACWALSSALA